MLLIGSAKYTIRRHLGNKQRVATGVKVVTIIKVATRVEGRE